MRTDHELERLLPSTLNLPTDWTVEQSSPINRARGGEGEPPSPCDRVPFDHMGWRSDADRDFHEIAAVTATSHPDQPRAQDIVRLAVPTTGSSVIDKSITWVRDCAASAGSGGRRHSAELLASTYAAGYPVTNIGFVNASTGVEGQTASLLQVRGILVVTMPALSSQHGPLGDKVIGRLQHAALDGPPAPSEPGGRQSVVEVQLPPASEEATRRLARVADGLLVNPEQYHFGGYQPGDARTRTPDYLHFRSPTGSIACSWRKYLLYCEVPRRSFPRMPKPVGEQGYWDDGVVVFGWDSIENGSVATDPLVYAESSVLPYGQTIRLEDRPYPTECLMERDGLTCVSYDTRLGLHLSSQDLTPLVATDALVRDDRPEPKS